MSDRKEFRELVSPTRAHEAISGLDLAPDPETVPLDVARGRVLAERVDAGIDVPGFDRASVDGYAVRARDTFGADEANPETLDHIGMVHAGTTPEVVVEKGMTAEISTGAVLPEGADAVVMVERTTERDNGNETEGDDGGTKVEIRKAAAPGDGVMRSGTDIAAGERALGPGTELTPREIGLLSALGVEEVPVRGRPTVGVISTGDELVRPGEEVEHAAGQIYDVNSYTIAAAIEDAGGEPELYPHAGDDYEEMERILRNAAGECDLVCSSGSTSASAVDVIYRVIEDRGDLLLHGVAVKPGKPMLVGQLEDSAYVGLPGYPVSALTIFRTFVAPAIRRAAGKAEPQSATIEGRMATRERYAEGRLRLMPVGLIESGPGEETDGSGGDSSDDSDGENDGGSGENGTTTGETETLVYPVDKGSGATTSLVEADGVVAVDPDTEYLAAGEAVSVELFSPNVRIPTLLGIGEDDPLLSRLLDGLERPRYLSFGSREGLRRLRNGAPDVAVVAGPGSPEFPVSDLGGWTREWGLVVPNGNPQDIEGIADLIDRDLSFVNRPTSSGLRTSLGEEVAELAAERGETRHDCTDRIRGFERALGAHESPPRAVAAGKADAGLGLRATAATLDIEFVPVGEETIRVLANPDRTEKSGLRALANGLEEISSLLDGLPGYGERGAEPTAPTR